MNRTDAARAVVAGTVAGFAGTVAGWLQALNRSACNLQVLVGAVYSDDLQALQAPHVGVRMQAGVRAGVRACAGGLAGGQGRARARAGAHPPATRKKLWRFKHLELAVRLGGACNRTCKACSACSACNHEGRA